MLLFFMNALWQLETKEFRRGASLFASNLEKIFAILWMRLIGLKYVTLKASAFFGSKTMHAEFNHSNPWAFNENRLFMVAMTSCLMVSQHALKKAPVKPSGPGALSDGIEFMIFWIFSWEKGTSRSERSCGV
jgi:hypothetical protein